MQEFDQKSVVITGAGRGIGRVIARAFAAETSHPLVLLARDAARLEAVRSECRELGARHVSIHPCDLTDEETLNAITLSKEFDQVGIVVNNAGGYVHKPHDDTTAHDMRDQLNNNMMSAFNTVKRFLSHFDRDEKGLIVNICSIAALIGLKRSPSYSVSKHALLGYSRSLREELKKTKIAVTAINLGNTWSTSWEGTDVDPQKLIDPEDIARLIITLSRMSPRSVVEELTLNPQAGSV